MMDLPPMQFGPFDMDDEDIPLPPEPDVDEKDIPTEYPWMFDPEPVHEYQRGEEFVDDYEGPDPYDHDDGGFDHRIVNHPEGFREP